MESNSTAILIKIKLRHSLGRPSRSDFVQLDFMYDGDKDRDAASKIRGFLFQDYVTIMCLLQDKVEYVCSEYLEDVDVFFNTIYGYSGFYYLARFIFQRGSL